MAWSVWLFCRGRCWKHFRELVAAAWRWCTVLPQSSRLHVHTYLRVQTIRWLFGIMAKRLFFSLLMLFFLYNDCQHTARLLSAYQTYNRQNEDMRNVRISNKTR